MKNLNQPVAQPWEQLRQDGLSVIMGRFNHSRWEESGLVGYGDVMALNTLNSYLTKIGISNYSAIFADQAHEDLLQNNIILLGGDVNKISMRFMNTIKTQIVHGYGITFVDQINDKSYAPLQSAITQEIITDYGLIVYSDNPFAEGTKALYIAGCFGYGTWGGVQHVTSYQFMQHDLVQNRESFECLVEITVRNEAPQVVTPLIMRRLPEN